LRATQTEPGELAGNSELRLFQGPGELQIGPRVERAKLRQAELADRLGVTPDDVTEAMEIGPAYVPLSLDQPIASGDGESSRSVSEQIGGADPELDRVEMRDVLDRAMEHLTPRERAIMAMRFYEQMSQSEIARRLGISQMHVSRLQRAALEQLRKYVPQESAS